MSELRDLRDALTELVAYTHMRVVANSRTGWYCPICKCKSRDFTALENGIGHAPTCAYARAVRVLDNT